MGGLLSCFDAFRGRCTRHPLDENDNDITSSGIDNRALNTEQSPNISNTRDYSKSIKDPTLLDHYASELREFRINNIRTLPAHYTSEEYLNAIRDSFKSPPGNMESNLPMVSLRELILFNREPSEMDEIFDETDVGSTVMNDIPNYREFVFSTISKIDEAPEESPDVPVDTEAPRPNSRAKRDSIQSQTSPTTCTCKKPPHPKHAHNKPYPTLSVLKSTVLDRSSSLPEGRHGPRTQHRKSSAPSLKTPGLDEWRETIKKIASDVDNLSLLPSVGEDEGNDQTPLFAAVTQMTTADGDKTMPLTAETENGLLSRAYEEQLRKLTEGVSSTFNQNDIDYIVDGLYSSMSAGNEANAGAETPKNNSTESSDSEELGLVLGKTIDIVGSHGISSVSEYTPEVKSIVSDEDQQEEKLRTVFENPGTWSEDVCEEERLKPDEPGCQTNFRNIEINDSDLEYIGQFEVEPQENNDPNLNYDKLELISEHEGVVHSHRRGHDRSTPYKSVSWNTQAKATRKERRRISKEMNDEALQELHRLEKLQIFSDAEEPNISDLQQRSIPHRQAHPDIDHSLLFYSNEHLQYETSNPTAPLDDEGHEEFDHDRMSKEVNSAMRNVSELIQEKYTQQQSLSQLGRSESSSSSMLSGGNCCKASADWTTSSDSDYGLRPKKKSKPRLGVSRLKMRTSDLSNNSTDSGVVVGTDMKYDTEITDNNTTSFYESGLGSWISADKSTLHTVHQNLCDDCGMNTEYNCDTDRPTPTPDVASLCKDCTSLRHERKEAILELAQTELSFGQDLNTINKEFADPMESSSLVTHEQCQAVFLNLSDLIKVNDRLLTQLQHALQEAVEADDTQFITVSIGKVFLQIAYDLLLAFEHYCTKQASAAAALTNIEKTKELLRVFLAVSRKENAALRRMDLQSFLLLPVQRLTKYPLLLNRVLKSTPTIHPDYSDISKAVRVVEKHLDIINKNTHHPEPRKWSAHKSAKGEKSGHNMTPESIELRKIALECVGWKHERVRFINTTLLKCGQLLDPAHRLKSYRAVKFQTCHLILLVLLESGDDNREVSTKETSKVDQMFFPSKHSNIVEACVVAVRAKQGEYISARDPFILSKCVVSTECNGFIEVQEMRHDNLTSVFWIQDADDHMKLFIDLKYIVKDVGRWRFRRNALPNIMILNPS